MRALSIAGAYPLLLAKGIKKIEIRKWEEKNYRGWVLLHCSSSKEYDFSYSERSISLKECPKSAVIGAAKLIDCIEYTKPMQWRRDIEKHQWDISYYEMLEYYQFKAPFGHIFENPIIFEQPIFNVSGTFRYWLPKADKEIKAFEQAAKFLSDIDVTLQKV